MQDKFVNWKAFMGIGVSVVKNGNNHAMFAFGQVNGGCYKERVKIVPVIYWLHVDPPGSCVHGQPHVQAEASLHVADPRDSSATPPEAHPPGQRLCGASTYCVVSTPRLEAPLLSPCWAPRGPWPPGRMPQRDCGPVWGGTRCGPVSSGLCVTQRQSTAGWAPSLSRPRTHSRGETLPGGQGADSAPNGGR